MVVALVLDDQPCTAHHEVSLGQEAPAAIEDVLVRRQLVHAGRTSAAPAAGTRQETPIELLSSRHAVARRTSPADPGAPARSRTSLRARHRLRAGSRRPRPGRGWRAPFRGRTRSGSALSRPRPPPAFAPRARARGSVRGCRGRAAHVRARAGRRRCRRRRRSEAAGGCHGSMAAVAWRMNACRGRRSRRAGSRRAGSAAAAATARPRRRVQVASAHPVGVARVPSARRGRDVAPRDRRGG